MFKTQFDEVTKLWSGRPIPSLYNSKISITQVVLKSCLRNGPKIAQVIE